MLSNVLVVASLALTLSLQVSAHAGISPMLGVTGKPARSDVQRPSKASECGNVDIAKTIDSSTAVQAAADGTFSATVTNFNAGKDGSRQVTLNVDSTGVGKNFVAGTVSKNGDSDPSSVGSVPIVAALPPGTKCTGGKSNDLCLASFTTTAGFGNCVVVKQAGNAAGTPAGSDPAQPSASPQGQPASAGMGSTDGANNGAASPNGKGNESIHHGAGSDCQGTPETTKKGGSRESLKGGKGADPKGKDGKKHKKHHNGTHKGNDLKKGDRKDMKSPAVGTRAPRALLQELGAREAVAGVKRGFVNWIWA